MVISATWESNTDMADFDLPQTFPVPEKWQSLQLISSVQKVKKGALQCRITLERSVTKTWGIGHFSSFGFIFPHVSP